MIYIDLDLGDLGYFSARVLYKNCTEPQAKGISDIRVFIDFNEREVEIFEQLTTGAKEHVLAEISSHIDEGAA